GRLGLLNNFHRRTWFINRNPSLLLRWSSVLLVEPTQLHTVSHDSHTRDPFGRTEPIAETRAHRQTRTPFRRNIHTVLSVADCRNTVRVAEPSSLNLHGRLCCGRHDIRGSSERVSGNDIGDGDVGKSWKIWSLGHQFNLRSFHIQLRLSDLAYLRRHDQLCPSGSLSYVLKHGLHHKARVRRLGFVNHRLKGSYKIRH